MSNHWHLVLYVDPQQPWAMTDEEVARCWLRAFPGPLKHADSPKMEERFVQALLGNPDRLEVLRGRLGSLSWFMKALNEPIARMANRALIPPLSPPFRYETPTSLVDGCFRDGADRRRSQSYVEDLRPSESTQMLGWAVS